MQLIEDNGLGVTTTKGFAHPIEEDDGLGVVTTKGFAHPMESDFLDKLCEKDLSPEEFEEHRERVEAILEHIFD